MKWRTVGAVAVLAALGAGAALWLSRPQPIVVESVEVGVARSPRRSPTPGRHREGLQRAKLAPPAAGRSRACRSRRGSRPGRAGAARAVERRHPRRALGDGARRAASRARREEACVGARVARRESARLQSLVERRLVSTELAERAAGEAEAREAACRAAAEQIRVAEARIEAARARLERTLLRAPFAGTVAEINGELGEFVTPSPVGIPTPPRWTWWTRAASTSPRPSTRWMRRACVRACPRG